MKIEEQVLSIEQMQNLKDLGVEVKDTALSWTKYPVYELDGKLGWRWRVVISEDGTMCKDGLIPTLTLQEILKLIPDEIRHEGKRFFPYMDIGCESVLYSDMIDFKDLGANRELHHTYDSNTLLDEAYNMLCWVAENGY